MAEQEMLLDSATIKAAVAGEKWATEKVIQHYTPMIDVLAVDEDINKALLSLPDKYLTPIVMYHNEGMKYTEISEALDLPLSMVKNRIYRGRKLLKEILEKEGKKSGLF